MTAIEMVRAAAHKWVDSANVGDLFMALPSEVFSMEMSNKPTKAQAVVSVAAEPEVVVPAIPAVATGQVEVIAEVSSQPTKSKARSRVPKKLGNFTEAKKKDVLARVGRQKLGTKEYKKLRDQLCEEHGINRQQVSQYVKEIRRVKNGTSSIGLAHLANARKRRAKARGR